MAPKRGVQTYVGVRKEVAMIDSRELSKPEITRLVYALYLLRGCRGGTDVEDWVRAENELTEERNASRAKTNAATQVARSFNI